VELDEFLEGETYGFQPLFYNNTLSDLLSQYIDELYLGNGEYSFIIDNQAENSILYLWAEPTKPTAVLSYAGINGKVISFGSAGFFVYDYGTDYEQFINNCANYLVEMKLLSMESMNQILILIFQFSKIIIPIPLNFRLQSPFLFLIPAMYC